MRVSPQLACIQYGVGFRVKNGDGVRFCFGDWLGKILLRSLFPTLFRFVSSFVGVSPQLACVRYGDGFRIMNGVGVRFCFGDWLGKGLLHSFFPRLF